VLNSAIAKKSTPYGRYLFYIPQPTDLVVWSSFLLLCRIFNNSLKEVEKILFYRQEKGDYLVKFKLRSYLQ
jgi:hypothetical protein